ncbi:MAG: TonB-dependent receptor [Bacteroidales bacterium]|jgi:TonB-linked SusC/RagA family outer membrane protein|nr:TonB-dependent receptor [Bacteroidales bacterium]NPV37550.1 TonB-dependent receptor [Bacteroidales bacterium]
MKRILLILIFLNSLMVAKPQTTLEGRVTDATTNEPLVGVTVFLKGTSIGTTTDVEGRYLLRNAAITPQSVIVFSFVGYKSMEVEMGNRKVIDVKLEPTSYMLGEAVVIGYGSVKKRNVLGAISKVDQKDIVRLPVAGVDQALQGAVAGVMVTQNTGAPGEGVSVRIRGIGSINSSNAPLYIVDGIPTADALNILSPSMIESVTVLKDASSAAIYGARANNGIVLITTKKGMEGKATFQYHGKSGFQMVTRIPKMVNTADYITVYNEAASNDNKYLPESLQRPLITAEDASKFSDINYLKELFVLAPINSHEISVSGKNGKTSYIMAGSFFDQRGVVQNTGYSRVSVNTNVNTELSRFITTGLSLLAGHSSTDIIGSSGDGYGGNGGSVVRYAFFRNPAIPIKFPDGTWVDRPAEYFGNQVYDSFLGDGYNPIGMAQLNDHNRKEDNLLAKWLLDVNFAKDLKWTTNAGLDYRNSYTRRFNPTWGTFNRINAKNSLNVTQLRTASWTVNSFFNYDFKAGELHTFNAMAGTEAIRNTGRVFNASDSDFPVQQDNIIYIGNGLGQKTVSQNEYASSLLSFFSRLNYDYAGKYYLSGTFRRDGTSRFVGKNRWGNFYSLSGGWIIKQEEFLKNVDWLENLKLRLGYGAIGNQEIGLYAYSDRISPYFDYPFGDQPNSGYAQTALGNQNLKWETSYQYNAGIDMEVWKGALALSLDYFYKITDDMLVKASYPPSAGYADAPWINNGSVLNTGLELEATYKKSGPEWNYSISGNVTWLHNEVKKLQAPLIGGRVESGVYATYTTEGQPIGAFYLLEMDGIFQNQTEILLSAFQGNNIRPGDVRFVDHNKDGKIDNQDRVYLGSAIPKITGGLNFSMNYRSWDVGLFLQGVAGNKIYMQILQDIEGFYRGFPVTQRYFDNRWTGEGTSNTQPRPSWSAKSNNARPSSRFLEDGSYLRVKNLQLGYTLPKTFLASTGLSKMRLYVSATNLFTFTSFPGLDPEMTVSDNSKNEGDRANGIDWGTYPSTLTLLMGVDLAF